MLSQYIFRERILINPKVKHRDGLFHLVAEDALKHDLVRSAQAMVEHLSNREAQGSTELEAGIAIPHAKFPEAGKAFVYVIVSKKGIRFGGRLSAGARLIFLLAAPPGDETYLQLLAHVARLLKKKEFKEGLLAADVEADVLNIVRKHEEMEKAMIPGKEGMHGIFLILNRREAIETAMTLMVELGVKGATILDSTNVKAKLTFDIPFMGLFGATMKKIDSKLLIGMTDSPETVTRLFTLLKAEGCDLSERGTGVLFSMPLGTMYGALDQDFDF